MLKKVVLITVAVLVGLIGLFCLVVALQPDTFSIQRTATMAAPPEKVFAQINDLQAWDRWTPWKKLDPNPTTTISTPSAGKGAKFTWSGNDEIGEGTLEILDSQPNERVELEQAFVRPREGKATIVFTLMREGEATHVIWKMEGKNGFMGKAVCMFMDMDAMLGSAFEQGLANMKAAVEKEGAAK